MCALRSDHYLLRGARAAFWRERRGADPGHMVWLRITAAARHAGCHSVANLSRAQEQGAAAGIRFQVGLKQGKERSEEHTSELQSHLNLVCRLLLEKKKQNKK